MKDTWPTISLVTPSFNMAGYLDAALRSVLDQHYPALEYFVVDGGSTDGSIDIIRSHEARLAGWISEPDGGMYDALNKGFARTSGEIMGWLNADDLHTPWALRLVAEVFAALPQVEWLTTLTPLVWDAEGKPIARHETIGFCRRGFLRGENLPGLRVQGATPIQQESTFWRRSLWERTGGRLDTRWRLAGDFELWARFFQQAHLHAIEAPIAGFRIHEGQQTASRLQSYCDEARRILSLHGGRPSGTWTSHLRMRLLPALPARRMMWKLGLLWPRPVCRHKGRSGGWQVETI